MAGRWTIRLAFAPYEGKPDGESAQGSEFWHPGPGGRSLIEEFESNRGGTKRTGLAVFWWDTQFHGSRVVWCFSRDEQGCVALTKPGHWEADQFVLQNEFERDGRRFSSREVFADFTGDSFLQTYYEGEVGKDLKLVLTIRAKRTDGRSQSQ